MRTAVWVTVALASLALAGCAEDANEIAQKDETFDEFDLEATEDTGIIRGVVVDPAIVPIEGVTLTVVETGAQAISNENGAFGFTGLEPGAYFLTAEKAGFGAVQQSAIVEANVAQPPVIKILMEQDPSTAPFVEYSAFNGYVACSFTLGVLSLAACGVDGVDEQLGHVFLEEHVFDRAPQWVQSEMVWENTQSAGDWMSVSWTDPGTNGQRRISAADGPSPLMTSWDRATFDEMNLTGLTLWLRVFSTAQDGTDFVDEETWNSQYRPMYGTLNSTGLVGVGETWADNAPYGAQPFGEDCVKYPVLFDACLNWRGVGMTVSQDYEMFTSTFFNLMPKDGWMFTEDGNHPLE